jgi:hypothetical protein
VTEFELDLLVTGKVNGSFGNGKVDEVETPESHTSFFPLFMQVNLSLL